MTFEAWKDETYIIRLEHILEKDEDSTLSADVVVDLTVSFKIFKYPEFY